ncbi:bifunctional phosphoribosylaminoimidazolecarboxamide formyltransferase/IMP cyclohydrolase [Catelliglobosispora koreensis]|uniref:bifunctional phosphoribosylaminoimidazolecarboxamide formyltransferase/IMP cyclohydrolase n=1 Tax=Catelliglobosispora koreensis TaxID=129052 RepID=UPI0003732BC6|nr:bifunctional phosphoribosylaminoimidazolecarboxamide formyltransferase/IMP cyclohydrolase [Catelliglobosispora koreensis]
MIRRALISVYDKTGITDLAERLHGAGVEIVSTGSTAAAIAAAGVPVTKVEELTGFPEILSDRVKTLHPKVHAGLLADVRLESHRAELAEHGIEPFDLLVSNLYPFQETVASKASIEECIAQIDIGGPAMVRAAAKNHANVAVVTSPRFYDLVLSALERGGFSDEEKRMLAAHAFADIADYDVAVAEWCAQELHPSDQWWPDFGGLALRRTAVLRYGENPHQRAALYTEPRAKGLAQAEQLGGKEMSYNNYLDADAAWRTAHDFSVPAVAIIKHQNPCGIAIADNVAEAHRKAHACDPTSAFGGVIAVNGEVTVELAAQVAEIFTEVIVAPSYADGAVDILSQKKNLRILRAPAYAPQSIVELRQISGGYLTQTRDDFGAPGDEVEAWQLAAGDPASPEVLDDLEFAWGAVRAVKSNAILLASGGASVGVGMGQVNRVDSCRLAIARAGDRAKGSVAASDAYFPFPDGLQVLIDAGVTAVVQPGGSIRDELAIEAANAAGITMYFTGARHFYH